MMLIDGEIVDHGLDYVTLTTTTEIEQDLTLQTNIERVWQSVIGLGSIERVKWGGYSGLKCGKARVGVRTREGYVDRILSISGPQSSRIMEAERDDLERSRCTRIDIQVTVRLSEPDPDLAKRYYEALSGDASYKRSMVGRRSVSLVQSDTGSTIYIGKRSSKGFIVRIYDKGGQKGGEKGELWRFEVEYKRQMSDRVLGGILDNGWDSQKILRELLGRLQDACGVVIKGFSSADTSLRDVDEEKKDYLGWVRRCVKPVVTREVNDGNVDEVLDALGLSWVTELTQVEMRYIADRLKYAKSLASEREARKNASEGELDNLTSTQ